MPLRLIELVLPQNHVRDLEELLKDEPVVDVWYAQVSETKTLIKILASVEETEHLMDLLDKYFSPIVGFRLILLPVAASIPRVAEAVEPPPTPGGETSAEEQRKLERISREELYATIKDMAKPSRIYLAMVGLSTVVAAIGIMSNSVAVVIGAMVIAPLLGPVIGLSLATTLGDIDLARLSLKAIAVGVLVALGLSMMLGFFIHVDPNLSEITSRTHIGLAHVVLALASGFAGALAFTAGVPATLVGVMVAVALLPPLVTMGLLLGAGLFVRAWGALLLLLTNMICVNLAGVLSFWWQGISPTTWWEENFAKRATNLSLVACAGLLAVLVVLILYSERFFGS
jgi:uncharacterized hydrophobic protein (TIGR00341 family)